MKKLYNFILFFLFFATFTAGAQLIVKQPVNNTICESDDGVFFSLTVNGDFNKYSFRWYKWEDSDWVEIPGPVGAGPTLTPPSPSEGKYMCVVTETATLLTEQSDEVTLTVDKAPSITGFTVPAVCDGDVMVASVDGGNTNGRDLISYEWKLHGNPIVGATNASGTISGNWVPNLSFVANREQNNQFLTITVENACGSSTFPLPTSPKAITVHATPPAPTPKPPKLSPVFAMARMRSIWLSTSARCAAASAIPSIPIFVPSCRHARALPGSYACRG